MESTSQLGCVLFSQFNVSFPTLELWYKCFYFSWRYFYFVVCCITYGNTAWNNVWKLRFVFDCHCDPFFFCLNHVICLFDVATFPDDVSITLYFGTFQLRMEMKWNYISFLFVIVTYSLFRHSYVIYLFHVVTFFDEVRNSFHICTLKLRMEITLQLRLVFVRHFNVFFITL